MCLSSEYHDRNEDNEHPEAGEHHPQGDTGDTVHQQEEHHEQRPTEGTHHEETTAEHTQQPVVSEEVHTQEEPSHGGATDQPEAHPSDGTPDTPAAHEEHPSDGTPNTPASHEQANMNTEHHEGQQQEQEHQAV